ncbi:MAG: hypothetical protein SGI92_20360 [Bryobacteraceae bacterium]|nr:hypothetical protein [Bryobacteraceae bacterium]
MPRKRSGRPHGFPTIDVDMPERRNLLAKINRMSAIDAMTLGTGGRLPRAD